MEELRKARLKSRAVGRALILGVAVTVLGAVAAVWRPWVDRTPFTAEIVSVQKAEVTDPGLVVGGCLARWSADYNEVIFDEDGTELGRAPAAREGTVLGPEFGDRMGDCMFVTRVEGIPGGHGTYFTQWAGGDKHEISEEDLRAPAKVQQEQFKTTRWEDLPDPAE
ncbi:hypothetical protein ACN20G_33490 (plasmid) [Streptomyces sp. BI20]|uniref:hypothetical protein n=1 Tax=Streptomyces sp. BI20 TaxID=3403460 RepID=UPI003C757879